MLRIIHEKHKRHENQVRWSTFWSFNVVWGSFKCYRYPLPLDAFSCQIKWATLSLINGAICSPYNTVSVETVMLSICHELGSNIGSCYFIGCIPELEQPETVKPLIHCHSMDTFDGIVFKLNPISIEIILRLGIFKPHIAVPFTYKTIQTFY